MPRLVRLASAAVFVVVLAWFLPYVCGRAFKGDRFQVGGRYSPIQKEFVLWESGPESFRYMDEAGAEYPTRKAQSLLPFMFPGNVNKWGGFPLAIDGRVIGYDEAVSDRQTVGVTPVAVNNDPPCLHVLMESEPEGARLSMPPDVLSVEPDALRFITAADGTVNEKKSAAFTKAMRGAGVAFPLRFFAGNPSPMKPFDEGAFLLDANNRMFQLKMAKGAPVCRDTGITVPGEAAYLDVGENERREFYGVVVTADSLYLNMYGGTLRKIPLPGYSPNVHTVNMVVDPLSRSIQMYDSANRLSSPTVFLAFDGEYSPLRNYSLRMPDRIVERQDTLDKGLSLLTPWRLEQFEAPLWQLGFHFSPSPSPLFILLGVISALFLYLIGGKLRRTPARAAEAFFLLATGLPGLAALALFGPLAPSSFGKECSPTPQGAFILQP